MLETRNCSWPRNRDQRSVVRSAGQRSLRGERRRARPLQRLCGLVRSFSVVHEWALITVTSCLCLRAETSSRCRVCVIDFYLSFGTTRSSFFSPLPLLHWCKWNAIRANRIEFLNRTLNINDGRSLIICVTRYSKTTRLIFLSSSISHTCTYTHVSTRASRVGNSFRGIFRGNSSRNDRYFSIQSILVPTITV